MTLEQRVLAYLTLILYPPVSKRFLPAAVQAIVLARQGAYDQKLCISKGRYLKVEQIIELLLLHSFVHESFLEPYLENIVIKNPIGRKSAVSKVLYKTLRSIFSMILSILAPKEDVQVGAPSKAVSLPTLYVKQDKSNT
jgi:hypothetical protein